VLRKGKQLLLTGCELMCSGRVSSSCSTSGTRRVNLVTNPLISQSILVRRTDFKGRCKSKYHTITATSVYNVICNTSSVICLNLCNSMLCHYLVLRDRFSLGPSVPSTNKTDKQTNDINKISILLHCILIVCFNTFIHLLTLGLYFPLIGRFKSLLLTQRKPIKCH
jgi:hypothetical protein